MQHTDSVSAHPEDRTMMLKPCNYQLMNFEVCDRKQSHSDFGSDLVSPEVLEGPSEEPSEQLTDELSEHYRPKKQID
ncbi:hypothetical protein ALQ58_01765 [Pseudomonas syringae pv. apii]|uniref:Uncharacterized protein n=2 Tax=Pseudomonas TaxID=286 RepID=A0A3M3RXG9_9PSED|nr:hypothetical protein ALQ58_01765 [Pseudomonas syringae pv. apii]RMO01025.1 hypothetical protein ALQ49_03891 [Pseudomonas syringae pv. apii]